MSAYFPNLTLTQDQAESLEDVLAYIFQHEQEDFQENPSTSHVYYQALRAAHGPRSAKEAYNEALSLHDEDEQ